MLHSFFKFINFLQKREYMAAYMQVTPYPYLIPPQPMYGLPPQELAFMNSRITTNHLDFCSLQALVKRDVGSLAHNSDLTTHIITQLETKLEALQAKHQDDMKQLMLKMEAIGHVAMHADEKATASEKRTASLEDQLAQEQTKVTALQKNEKNLYLEVNRLSGIVFKLETDAEAARAQGNSYYSDNSNSWVLNECLQAFKTPLPQPTQAQLNELTQLTATSSNKNAV